jgi:hypothetical protein
MKLLNARHWVQQQSQVVLVGLPMVTAVLVLPPAALGLVSESDHPRH